jgi:hypothetical protein
MTKPRDCRASLARGRVIPAVRLATLSGGAAILLFGAPTDARSAIGALVAAVVSPPAMTTAATIATAVLLGLVLGLSWGVEL